MGVSRRKQDQRAREEEEKEREKRKYDELVERGGNIDGIMEIEEEGKEDMSQMASVLCCTVRMPFHACLAWPTEAKVARPRGSA